MGPHSAGGSGNQQLHIPGGQTRLDLAKQCPHGLPASHNPRKATPPEEPAVNDDVLAIDEGRFIPGQVVGRRPPNKAVAPSSTKRSTVRQAMPLVPSVTIATLPLSLTVRPPFRKKTDRRFAKGRSRLAWAAATASIPCEDRRQDIGRAADKPGTLPEELEVGRLEHRCKAAAPLSRRRAVRL